MHNEQSVKNSLNQWLLPELGASIVEANWVKRIECSQDIIKVKLVAGFPCDSKVAHWKQQIEQHLAEHLKVKTQVDLSWSVASHTHKAGVPSLAGVKNLIAIASGKGGVGKSTTAVNVALALAAEGAKVGLLDADIYGPSQPIMLGKADAKPEALSQKEILSVESYGLQTMSIGYLVDPEQAMVWRGPMASGALQQLINDTQWRDLDYLIIDLPPGTGDIQLTLSQKVPLTAAVVITTPQDIALADALKGISMFNKVNVPVLGVIENMGMHVCTNCGHVEHIFGEGGGSALAHEQKIEFLGSLPLSRNIRDDADKGKPTVVADPHGAVATQYAEIARTLTARLARQAKDYSQSFPTISITND